MERIWLELLRPLYQLVERIGTLQILIDFNESRFRNTVKPACWSCLLQWEEFETYLIKKFELTSFQMMNK